MVAWKRLVLVEMIRSVQIVDIFRRYSYGIGCSYVRERKSIEHLKNGCGNLLI